MATVFAASLKNRQGHVSQLGNVIAHKIGRFGQPAEVVLQLGMLSAVSF